jgi:hypothetical protein
VKFGCFFTVLVPGHHCKTPYGGCKNLVQILLQIVPIHARYPSRDARWKTYQRPRARESWECKRQTNGRKNNAQSCRDRAAYRRRGKLLSQVGDKKEVSIREGMTEHQKILYWAFSKLRAASQSYDRSLQVERLANFVCIGIYGTAGAIDVLPLQKTWRRGTKTESTN